MKYQEIERRSESGAHCFLFRDAIQNNWINREHEISNTGSWMVPFFTDRKEQLQAFLCESLVSALEHWDLQIAVRACFQATAYVERLHTLGWAGGGRYEDALREAQQRIESWVTSRECLYNLSGLTFDQWWSTVRSIGNVPGMYRTSESAMLAWKFGASPETWLP